MNRKITYGLLTILLFGGLYFGLRFAFGIFTPFNYLTARHDIEIGQIQIVEIGEMPLNFEKKQKLANSYGFKLHLFGCDLKTDIINGTECYNKKMIEHLKTEIGNKRWAEFQVKLNNIDNEKSNLRN